METAGDGMFPCLLSGMWTVTTGFVSQHHQGFPPHPGGAWPHCRGLYFLAGEGDWRLRDLPKVKQAACERGELAPQISHTPGWSSSPLAPLKTKFTPIGSKKLSGGQFITLKNKSKGQGLHPQEPNPNCTACQQQI